MRHHWLYLSAGALVLLALLLTLVPALYPAAAQFIFRPASLAVLYACLSLAIAVVVFGVLGDSGALVKLTRGTGQVVQISGSAAGFVVFFYMLSSGLAPYSWVTVSLYKDRDSPLGPADGPVRVMLQSTITQIRTTSDGEARFAIQKSNSDVGRISVLGEGGIGWRISDFTPKHCVLDDRQLSPACDYITLYLSAQQSCYDNVSVAWHWKGSEVGTLESWIKEITQNFNRGRSKRAPLDFQFSDVLLGTKIQREKFSIAREIDTEQPLCSHLGSIENSYNLHKSKRAIRVFKSCDKIFVALANEAAPEGYTPCL